MGEGTAAAGGDYSIEALSARILERHRDSIRVKKPHVAVGNLARIVHAALDLSNRHGFHAMTLRQLAEASGLSMGALYSYLDSKDTLLLMILDEVSHAIEEALAAAPDDARANPAQHLRWLIATHIRVSDAMHPWFVFSYMEAKAFPAEARRRAVESELATERVFADVLAEGARQGLFRLEDPQLVASLVKPLLQDWYVKRSKHRKRGLDAASYAAGVTAFVEAALAPDGARTTGGAA